MQKIPSSPSGSSPSSKVIPHNINEQLITTNNLKIALREVSCGGAVGTQAEVQALLICSFTGHRVGTKERMKCTNFHDPFYQTQNLSMAKASSYTDAWPAVPL